MVYIFGLVLLALEFQLLSELIVDGLLGQQLLLHQFHLGVPLLHTLIAIVDHHLVLVLQVVQGRLQVGIAILQLHQLLLLIVLDLLHHHQFLFHVQSLLIADLQGPTQLTHLLLQLHNNRLSLRCLT